MSEAPFSCPSCGTYVRLEWTERCGACGHSWAAAPAPEEASSPSPSTETALRTEGVRYVRPSGGTSSSVKLIAIVLAVVGALFLGVIVVCIVAVTFLGSSARQEMDETSRQQLARTARGRPVRAMVVRMRPTR